MMYRAIALLAALPLTAQLRDLKPGFNLFSPEHDIQIGKESAAQVERTRPVIRDSELTGYLTRIAGRLAASKRSGTFQFRFSVINDPEINAFALPGGPIYVNTGLLAAVDNETQLAGVLAHEMSHVALRHGTHEASKAAFVEIPVILASEAIGDNDSMLAKLAQVGINFGAQSVLLKNSRSAESEADLNGARIMNDSGYDPVGMARFFDKLEQQGSGGGNGLLANWLSDHPSPGNRVKSVEDEIRYLPRIRYSEVEPGTLPRIKSIVAKLPRPPKQAPN
jgi:predicted Zn-dependent protease